MVPPPPPALFGITNDGLNLAVNLVLLVLVVLWLALVYWTWADARRRIEDSMLVGCATAASLFPFVGTIVYIIVRPPEYLDDVRERELEMQAAEARLHQLDHQLCPHCDHAIERDYLRCPYCLRKLKEPCHACTRPVDPSWRVCPYCETELGAAAFARRPPGWRGRTPVPPDGQAARQAPRAPVPPDGQAPRQAGRAPLAGEVSAARQSARPAAGEVSAARQSARAAAAGESPGLRQGAGRPASSDVPAAQDAGAEQAALRARRTVARPPLEPS